MFRIEGLGKIPGNWGVLGKLDGGWGKESRS